MTGEQAKIQLGVVGSPPVADTFRQAGFEVVSDPTALLGLLRAEPGAFPVWVAASAWDQVADFGPGLVFAWVSVGPGTHPQLTASGEPVTSVDLPASVAELITAAGGRPESMVAADQLGLVAEPPRPQRAVWTPAPARTGDSDARPARLAEPFTPTAPASPTTAAPAPQPWRDPVPEPAPYVPPAVEPQQTYLPPATPAAQPRPEMTLARLIGDRNRYTTPTGGQPGPQTPPAGVTHMPPFPADGPNPEPVTRREPGPTHDPDDFAGLLVGGGERTGGSTTQRRGGGQVIIVFSGRGGVGKSSLAQALAATAAAEGLRTVLVDSNVGQPDQLKMLAIGERAGLASIIDAADTGEPKAAFVGPNDLNAVRDPGLRPVRFVVVPGPPRGQANHPGITPELYLKVIRYAQQVADLVVVDTQIVEGDRDDSGMVRGMILPVLTSGGWGLGVSDASRPGIAYLLDRSKQMVDRGVPPARLLSLVNKVPDTVKIDTVRLEERLQTVSRLVGVVPARQELILMSNRGETLAGAPVLAHHVEQILNLVTGMKVHTAPFSGGSDQTGRRPDKPGRKPFWRFGKGAA